MGSHHSKQGPKTEDSDGVVSELVHDFITALRTCKTNADKISLCVCTVQNFDNVIASYLSDCEDWVKVKNPELRAQLGSLIADYGSLLNSTVALTNGIYIRCKTREILVRLLEALQEEATSGYQVSEEDLEPIREDFAKPLIEVSDLFSLIARHEDLLAKIQVADKLVSSDAKHANKKMWRCIIIAGLSALVLSACVAIAVGSFGVATAPATAAGVAAVEGMQFAAGGAAMMGVAGGVIGGISSVSTLVTSAVLAKALSDMQDNMNKTSDALNCVKTGIDQMNEDLGRVKAAGECTNEKSLLHFLTPRRLRIVNPKDIERIQKDVECLRETARGVRVKVDAHHHDYVRRLVGVKNALA